MEITPSQKATLLMFGARCCNCAKLATRGQLLFDAYRIFACGSLRGGCNCDPETLLDESTLCSHEIEFHANVRHSALDKHVGHAPMTMVEYKYVTTRPYFCDSCGDPSKEYEDIDVADLVRLLDPKPTFSILDKLLK